MEKAKKIWLNGKMIKWEKAQVHVLTHALHYGSAVFEGIRFYDTKKGPAVFLLKEHIKRLFESAAYLDMKIPFSQKEVVDATVELVRVNKVKSGYIRPLAYLGYGKMGLNPAGAPPQLAIALWPWGSYLGEGSVKVKLSSFMRNHPKSLHPQAKISGHYVNSIMASMEAKKMGYDEALLLDYKGKIAEGPGENIFIVKGGKLYTPKPHNILIGLTRGKVMEMAENEGYSITEKDLTVDDLLEAEEAFFTGTAAEITPISQVDKHKINKGKTGPVTSHLKKLFTKVVQGEDKRYEKWLSYCK